MYKKIKNLHKKSHDIRDFLKYWINIDLHEYTLQLLPYLRNSNGIIEYCIFCSEYYCENHNCGTYLCNYVDVSVFGHNEYVDYKDNQCYKYNYKSNSLCKMHFFQKKDYETILYEIKILIPPVLHQIILAYTYYNKNRIYCIHCCPCEFICNYANNFKCNIPHLKYLRYMELCPYIENHFSKITLK
jgi:hypothetical protein